MPSHRFAPAPAARRGSLRALVLAGAAAAAAAAVLVPSSAASADTGTTTTVVGQLMQAWPETEHSGTTATPEAQAPESWIQTPAGESVPVATQGVSDVPLGATVSVTLGSGGAGQANSATGQTPLPVVDSTVVEKAPPAPVVPARRFTNEVTVALVAPAGSSPDGTTPQQVADLVDSQVADFWSEQTDGAVRIGVTATRDWITTTAGCSSAATLWNEVAAKVKFTAGPGKHLLVYLPRSLTRCEYALAEVGRATTSGGRLYVRDAKASVIAHELGHNFGLGHSSGRQCDAAVDAGDCRTAPYRDFYDVMGVSWGELGTLNALQASRLKVLPAAAQQSVPVDGNATSVTLAPLSGRTGTRALELTDAAGVQYWLEYRAATGQDAWLATGDNAYGLDSGVLVRRSGTFPDTSLLLDGTPAASAGWDADLQSALPVGTAVPIAGGQFSVEVQSAAAGGAVVRVVPNPPATDVAPADAPADTGAGQVLAGAPASAGAAAAAGVPTAEGPGAVTAPDADPAGSVRVTAATAHTSPALQAAADSSGGSVPVLVAAGALVAAATLLGAGRVRRTIRAR